MTEPCRQQGGLRAGLEGTAFWVGEQPVRRPRGGKACARPQPEPAGGKQLPGGLGARVHSRRRRELRVWDQKLTGPSGL